MKITSAYDTYKYFKPYKDYDVEVLLLISLNENKEFINFDVLSSGTEESVYLDYMNLSRVLEKNNAKSFILLHNHPFKNVSCVSPSPSDNKLTFALYHYFKKNNINMLDHIIFNKDNFYSYNDNEVFGDFDIYTDSKLIEESYGFSQRIEDEPQFFYS